MMFPRVQKTIALICVFAMIISLGSAAGLISGPVTKGNMTVLIIDDDNDIHFDDDDSIARFEAVLLSMGYTVTTEDATATDDSTWSNYDFIVWSCGDDLVPVLDEAYKLSLIDYVNAAGRLIIESGNIAYDLDTQSRPSGDLFRDTVLHATGDWIYSDVDDITVKAATHMVATTPNALPATISFTETNPGDYSGDADAVRCRAEAVGIYGWSGMRWAGSPPIASVIAACNSIITYDDDANELNGGQTVYLTIDIDDIDSVDTQNQLIENAVTWVAGIPVADDVGIASIDAPTDSGTYPAGTMDINATVENYGTNDQSNFDVSCEIIEIVQIGSTTPILSENFDEGGALPAGWDNSIFTHRDWQSTNDAGRYGAIVDDGTDYGFVCDSDQAGSGLVDSWLNAPSVDCTAYDIVELNFTHRYNWYGEVEPEGIYVYLATDGSVDSGDNVVYHSVGSDIALTTESIDISAFAAGQGDVQVGFRYVGDYDYWWVVDDVLVNGIVPQIETTVYGPVNQTITVILSQNDTTQVGWSYLFSNATDYRIIIHTWLAADENLQNDMMSIVITITNEPYHLIDLVTGWNLISIPLEVTDTSIPNVFSSIDGKWDNVKYFDQTDVNDHWKGYSPAKPPGTNDLLNIDNTMGFWIHVTEPCTLNVTGTVPTFTNITLFAGWNLVGYPSMTGRNITDALAGTGYDKPVEGFNATSPYLISQYSDAYMMQPGEGYWVHVPADTVWVVDW